MGIYNSVSTPLKLQDVDIPEVLYQTGEHLLDPCLRGIVGPADPSLTMLLAPLTAVDRLDVLQVNPCYRICIGRKIMESVMYYCYMLCLYCYGFRCKLFPQSAYILEEV